MKWCGVTATSCWPTFQVLLKAKISIFRNSDNKKNIKLKKGHKKKNPLKWSRFFSTQSHSTMTFITAVYKVPFLLLSSWTNQFWSLYNCWLKVSHSHHSFKSKTRALSPALCSLFILDLCHVSRAETNKTIHIDNSYKTWTEELIKQTCNWLVITVQLLEVTSSNLVHRSRFLSLSLSLLSRRWIPVGR